MSKINTTNTIITITTITIVGLLYRMLRKSITEEITYKSNSICNNKIAEYDFSVDIHNILHK